MAKEQGDTLKGLGQYFAENTSMHGVSRIVGKPGFLRRSFWTLAVLGGAGVAAYNIQKIFFAFLSWEVSTVVSLEYNSLVTFPSVTFCNLNPVRKSTYASDPAESVTSTPPGSASALVAPGLGSLLSGITGTITNVTSQTLGVDVSVPLLPYPDWSNLNLDTNYFTSYIDDFTRKLLLHKTLEQIPLEDKVRIGHNISDTMIECSFQGYPCAPSNFTHFYNYMYGNCYTFNPKESAHEVITRSGPLYGFSVTLYAEEYEYDSALSDSVGFKVVVHKSTKMPFPENQGFDVTPGTSTSVGVTKVEIERAPHPYGECMRFDDNSSMPYSIFDYLLPDLGYSDVACEKTCYQELLITKCGCCDSRYPCTETVKRRFSNYSPEKITYCDFQSKTDGCAAGVREDYEYIRTDCHKQCPANCLDETHQLEISAAGWPASGNVKPLSSAVISRAENKGVTLPITESSSDAEKKAYLRENTLKITVYYKQLNFERIETSPSYDWSSLLSDLGGQAGLWLGFSLLTLGEILELILDVVVTCFKKCCLVRPQVQPQPEHRTKW